MSRESGSTTLVGLATGLVTTRVTKRASLAATLTTLLTILTLAGACGAPAADSTGGDEADGAPPSEGVYGTSPRAAGGIPSVVSLVPLGQAEGMSAGAGADGSTGAGAVGSAGAVSSLVPAQGMVDQFGLAFSPRLLLVATGTAVRFTNSESSLTHNVHLRSLDGDSTVFDGDASTGETIQVILDGEGGYDVLCDMHPGMSAFVYASTAPYAVFAAEDGAFDLGTVPPGRYEVRLWTAAGGPAVMDTITAGAGATEVQLAPSS